jgi:hypothetical protein
VATLTLDDVRRARAVSQLLVDPGDRDVAGVATWFGAMQAQDLQSGLWSFGVRLPQLDRSAVETAVAAGEVLRTWPMRGTLHFVPAQDARWMLRTTGARVLRTTSARWAALGLDGQTADAAVDVFAEALTRTPRLTRAALLTALQEAGIDTAGQRGYHLLWYASQRGVTCLGPNEGSEQTFVLLAQHAPRQRDLTEEDALAELALRYFRSHGPTTRQDFMGWSGLTAVQARAGIAGCGEALATYDHNGTPLLADPAALDHPWTGPLVRLLPGFDEVVLGYKDRSGFVPEGRMDDIVPGRNGVFRSSVLVDGMVAGTWQRTIASRGVHVDVTWFDQPEPAVAAAADEQAQRYADYLGLPLL